MTLRTLTTDTAFSRYGERDRLVLEIETTRYPQDGTTYGGNHCKGINALASNRLPLTTQARAKEPSMPTRTYATDVYLTCPCPECEGREVRITLRKFCNLSPHPSPACDQAVHQLVSGGDDKTR